MRERVRPRVGGYDVGLTVAHMGAAAPEVATTWSSRDKPPPVVGARQRYHHIVWTDVLPLIEEVWRDDEPAAVAYADAAVELIASLATSWTEWRAGWMAEAASVAVGEPAVAREELWELIMATAEDGNQRALDACIESGESLEDVRDQARDLIIGAPAGSAAKHVLPWIWSSQTSGGRPLTSAGGQIGAELRLSRYAKPQFNG